MLPMCLHHSPTIDATIVLVGKPVNHSTPMFKWYVKLHQTDARLPIGSFDGI